MIGIELFRIGIIAVTSSSFVIMLGGVQTPEPLMMIEVGEVVVIFGCPF